MAETTCSRGHRIGDGAVTPGPHEPANVYRYRDTGVAPASGAPEPNGVASGQGSPSEGRQVVPEPMASEPAEPTTRQDEGCGADDCVTFGGCAVCGGEAAFEARAGLIYKAARVIHGMRYTPSVASLTVVDETIATALADAGLLADPAQTTTVVSPSHCGCPDADRLYDELEQAFVSACTERDALSLLLRGMARKLVAYRKWALKAHRDQDWVLSRVRAALGTPDGRAVSVHAAEVAAERDTLRIDFNSSEEDLTDARRERDLALWLHAESEWWLSQYKHDVVLWKRQVDDLTADREERQARIDAALQLIDVFTATGPHFLSPDETREVRAALVGDQPKAEEPNCCDWPDDHAGKECPERDQPGGELLSIEPL